MDPEESILNMVSDVIISLVSASQKPGKAINVTPIQIELKLGARLVRVNEFPIRSEAHKGHTFNLVSGYTLNPLDINR